MLLTFEWASESLAGLTNTESWAGSLELLSQQVQELDNSHFPGDANATNLWTTILKPQVSLILFKFTQTEESLVDLV